jgi:predicted amidohydrolase
VTILRDGKEAALGVSLDDVVRATTETPARTIRALGELGTLAPEPRLR